MNILFDINHPAHVHLLRNTYFALRENGHTVYVTVKDIPAAKSLLTYYGIPYVGIGRKGDSLAVKGDVAIRRQELPRRTALIRIVGTAHDR